MADMLTDVVVGLERARDEASLKVAQAQAELNRITFALAELTRDLVVRSGTVRAQDFAGLGIVEAARRVLKDIPTGLSTNELWEEIAARGVVSKSKNPVPTVYATLTNATKEFTRKKIGTRGVWLLKGPR